MTLLLLLLLLLSPFVQKVQTLKGNKRKDTNYNYVRKKQTSAKKN